MGRYILRSSITPQHHLEKTEEGGLARHPRNLSSIKMRRLMNIIQVDIWGENNKPHEPNPIKLAVLMALRLA